MTALYDMGFVVRVPSWHKLETTIFEEYPGREVAFAAAGHDFEVVEVSSGSEGGIVADPSKFNGPMVRVWNDDGEAEWRSYRRNPKEKALRISQPRNGAPGPLHGKDIKTVNATYEPIQNSVPWDMLDVFLSDESINKSMKVHYETGGVLEGGASCFITAWLDFPFQIPGDDSKVYPYLYAHWRHDAAGGLTFGGTSVRIVCSNTRGMADTEATKTGRIFTFKHTKNVMARIEDAKMALKGIVVEHSEFQKLAESLASINVTEAQREEFVQRFIPYPASGLAASSQVSERTARNIEEARAVVRRALASPSVPEDHKLTGWGLYNAATEYLDHLRPGRGGSGIEKNPSSYVKRQLLTRNTAKDVIVPMIREVASVA